MLSTSLSICEGDPWGCHQSDMFKTIGFFLSLLTIKQLLMIKVRLLKCSSNVSKYMLKTSIITNIP